MITFGQGRQPIVTPVAVAGQAGRRGSGFLAGTSPPQPSDGEDGDFWVEEREGQANLVYGPKANGEWPAEPSSTLGVGGVADVPGLPEKLDGKATRGHTPVPDANYQCLQNDVQVGMIALTAPRTISLPDVDSFPLGHDLLIADESGACSDALTITIQPGSGTGDIIGGPEGATTIVLFSPYQAVRLRRGAANLWIRP